jgi:hypothetical protein
MNQKVETVVHQNYELYNPETEELESGSIWMSSLEAGRKNKQLRKNGEPQRWIAQGAVSCPEEEDEPAPDHERELEAAAIKGGSLPVIDPCTRIVLIEKDIGGPANGYVSSRVGHVLEDRGEWIRFVLHQEGQEIREVSSNLCQMIHGVLVAVFFYEWNEEEGLSNA